MSSGGVDIKRGIQMIICEVCSKKFEYDPKDVMRNDIKSNKETSNDTKS